MRFYSPYITAHIEGRQIFEVLLTIYNCPHSRDSLEEAGYREEDIEESFLPAIDPQQSMPEPAATAFIIPAETSAGIGEIHWRDQYRNGVHAGNKYSP